MEVTTFTRSDHPDTLASKVLQADLIFHLAGINRTQDPAEFKQGNLDLTKQIAQTLAMRASKKPKTAIVYTSSTQANLNNLYGSSKREAEEVLFNLARVHSVHVFVFRLPNVFGKWCRPNYNSVVATFCHNIARDLPIQINDPSAKLRLAYVDDVIAEFVTVLDRARPVPLPGEFADINPTYDITVGSIADQIRAFRTGRDSAQIERVGVGLVRALYATYVSYLPAEAFSYSVPVHADARGVFVEMLKTPDAGQFSFLTAMPGVTRGGHYHHTKTEKFLVIRGQARFRFRHMQTGELHELETRGQKPEIVETVPGWTHDITNIGSEEMVVMLWANEIFDRAKPDTYACPV